MTDNFYIELARWDAAIETLNECLAQLRQMNRELSDMLTIQEAENHANKIA